MPGDSRRRVIPGSPLNISAETWNRVLRLVEAGERRTGRDPAGIVHQSGVVYVKNTTGVDQPRFAILGIDSPIIDHTTQEDEFKRQVTVTGVLPEAGTHNGKFVVLHEPLAAGEEGDEENGAIGRAVIAGVTICYVAGGCGDRAGIVDGEPGYLQVGANGTAGVLWLDDGETSESEPRLAIVRLGETTHRLHARITSRTETLCNESGSPTSSTRTEWIYTFVESEYRRGTDCCWQWLDKAGGITGSAKHKYNHKLLTGQTVEIERAYNAPSDDCPQSGSGEQTDNCGWVIQDGEPADPTGFRYFCNPETELLDEFLVGAIPQYVRTLCVSCGSCGSSVPNVCPCEIDPEDYPESLKALYHIGWQEFEFPGPVVTEHELEYETTLTKQGGWDPDWGEPWIRYEGTLRFPPPVDLEVEDCIEVDFVLRVDTCWGAQHLSWSYDYGESTWTQSFLFPKDFGNGFPPEVVQCGLIRLRVDQELGVGTNIQLGSNWLEITEGEAEGAGDYCEEEAYYCKWVMTAGGTIWEIVVANCETCDPDPPDSATYPASDGEFICFDCDGDEIACPETDGDCCESIGSNPLPNLVGTVTNTAGCLTDLPATINYTSQADPFHPGKYRWITTNSDMYCAGSIALNDSNFPSFIDLCSEPSLGAQIAFYTAEGGGGYYSDGADAGWTCSPVSFVFNFNDGFGNSATITLVEA